MRLGDLNKLLAPWLASGFADEYLEMECAGACSDSREAAPGMLFCAIRGAVTDGARFIPQALASGAAAVITDSDTPVPDGIPVLRLRPHCGYHAVARTAEAFAGFPARRLRLFGITGTCGKTTTAYLFRDIMREAGIPCGMIGTVVYDTGDGEKEADRTTPTPFVIQDLFRRMVENGLECAVMECSSAALDQERMGDARFAGAVFTNFSRDHLDYHPSMEAYFQAKCKLFDEMLAENAPAVINMDDQWGARLASGIGERQLVKLTLPGGERPWQSKLPGRFNDYNAAAAALLALNAAGIPEETIRRALMKSHGAPGRMEARTFPGGLTAYVDYAHTPEEIAKALETLRPICRGRLAILFGCGGDRDRGKRPEMARAASCADMLWVTSDNPRTENPEAIIADVMPGVAAGTLCRTIPDREAAIADAVSALGDGDILLVAGKGHESYQEINGVKHPFSDSAVLRRLGGM